MQLWLPLGSLDTSYRFPHVTTSSVHVMQILRLSDGIGPVLRLPSVPFRANIPTLQDSLYATGCCFAPLSLRDTSLQHIRSQLWLHRSQEYLGDGTG